MHVLTNAEKLIPRRDAASLAESRKLAGIRIVTGTTSPFTRYERISVSPASCSIRSEYVIAFYTFKLQYKCNNSTPAWEQRKLGEFGSVAMCKRIYKEQTSEQGDVPFFKIGTFGADPDAFISNELFEDYKRTYPYPTPGTLLISAAGSIGRIVEYQGEKAYFQDSNIVWLEHDHRLNDAFLKPLYSKIEWGLEGSTIKRLYNKDLLSAEVTIPDGREQKEIGQFFAKLDSLITLHQRKRLWFAK
ncbi:restriction endonuclease subunit S [Bifidobacterium longum]|nr:restriction endonuclease subunit S [Bifidobacterium longum]